MRRWWTVPTADRRKGFTFVETALAFAIASMIFFMTYRMVFYQRKSAEYSARIENLRMTRHILSVIARDVEAACRIVGPAWDTSGHELRIMDAEYRPLRFRLQDEQNRVLSTADEIRSAKKVFLVRVVGAAAAEEALPVSKVERLDRVDFTRLGRNLLGVTVSLRPAEKQDPADPSLTFTTTLHTGRRVD